MLAELAYNTLSRGPAGNVGIKTAGLLKNVALPAESIKAVIPHASNFCMDYQKCTRKVFLYC